jgi:N-acetylglucosaminyldiphosphoundecaprenol N-acetyl-beta-D-mannosaminyltransferase
MENNKLLMGYRINTQPLHALINLCSQRIRHKEEVNTVFSCANPHSLATATSKNEFEAALNDAELFVTDGIGLSIIAKFLGINVGPRITGSDFFTALMNQENNNNGQPKTRVYFFGSSEKVLSLMKEHLEKKYPNIDFCGFTSPPYGDWSEAQNSLFIETINTAKPDILWVGMTAPKQEIWTHTNRHKLDVAVIGNIGAVFDFTAGTYERAPEWARKMGLEWLVRLCKEPKRMWRRNIISPVIFTLCAIRHTFAQK